MTLTGIFTLKELRNVSKNKKAIPIPVFPIFVLLILSPVILAQPVLAGGRLDVNVHVPGPGQACVFSPEEDLGCKTAEGPGVLKFKFGEEVVEIGEQFTACFEGNCVTGMNNPEIKPEDVYPASTMNQPTGNTVTATDNSLKDTWRLIINMVNPPESINNFHAYVFSTENYNQTITGLWDDYNTVANPNIANVIMDIPSQEIGNGDSFMVCVNYDTGESNLVNVPCNQVTYNNADTQTVTISLS
jgi:hypothetical protein